MPSKTIFKKTLLSLSIAAAGLMLCAGASADEKTLVITGSTPAGDVFAYESDTPASAEGYSVEAKDVVNPNFLETVSGVSLDHDSLAKGNGVSVSGSDLSLGFLSGAKAGSGSAAEGNTAGISGSAIRSDGDTICMTGAFGGSAVSMTGNALTVSDTDFHGSGDHLIVDLVGAQNIFPEVAKEGAVYAVSGNSAKLSGMSFSFGESCFLEAYGGAMFEWTGQTPSSRFEMNGNSLSVDGVEANGGSGSAVLFGSVLVIDDAPEASAGVSNNSVTVSGTVSGMDLREVIGAVFESGSVKKVSADGNSAELAEGFRSESAVENLIGLGAGIYSSAEAFSASGNSARAMNGEVLYMRGADVMAPDSFFESVTLSGNSAEIGGKAVLTAGSHDGMGEIAGLSFEGSGSLTAEKNAVRIFGNAELSGASAVGAEVRLSRGSFDLKDNTVEIGENAKIHGESGVLGLLLFSGDTVSGTVSGSGVTVDGNAEVSGAPLYGVLARATAK